MKNMSGLDQLIRLVLSVPLLVLLFMLESTWRFVGLLGIVLLVTALFRSCLFYRMLGISTCKAGGSL
jgi:hypothetical protein